MNNEADHTHKIRALIDNSDFDEALEYLNKLRTKDPSNVTYWNLAGDIYVQIKTWEKALYSYQQTINFDPLNIHAHLNIGRTKNQLGDSTSAETAFQSILRIIPDHAEANAEIGTLYSDQKNMTAAVAAYRKACDAAPDNTTYLCNLGYALQTLGCYDEAITRYKTALEIHPGIAQIEINLAFAYSATNAFDKALLHYRRTQSLDPSWEDAVIGEADIMEKTGKLEQSYSIIKPLILGGTRNTAALCLYAMLSTHFGFQQHALAMISRGLEDGTKPKIERARLLFNAGAIHVSIKQTDDAFIQYDQGNKLAYSSFDSNEHEKTITHFIEHFMPEDATRMQSASNKSEKPVFIVGMPRSGTSLVEQVLASHPKVFGAGELPCIHDLVVDIVDNITASHVYPECCEELTITQMDFLAERYLSIINNIAPDHLRVVDKMPENFLHLGLLNQLFPDAYIIHCVRNPIDTCLSCYFRLFSSRHEYTNNLTTLGQYYIQYQRLMDHWKNTLKVPMLEIRYEDLVSNQEESTKTLLEFCGLDWDDQCLNFHQTTRPVLSASYDTVRKPIFHDSMGKWKQYRHHIKDLLDALSPMQID